MNLYNYILQFADNYLILGHRISEWCGHSPALEEDIALSNISLDLFGQVRNFYTYAAEIEGKGKTEDDIAFLRKANEYKNTLLVEQPNKDFAHSNIRDFLFHSFNFFFLQELQKSNDQQLSAIAEKSLKECEYHVRHTKNWVLRLGDGTEESHNKIQDALNELWSYSGELFETTDLDNWAAESGVGVNLKEIKPHWEKYVKGIFDEATLSIPENPWMHSGGKKGIHSEHMGYILAELQYMQRAYPGCEW